MGRYASAGNSGNFKQAPAGSHAARCIGIVDIGTQMGEWQGKPIKRNQIIMRWELPFEQEEFDGQQKPLIVSKFYTNSLSQKATLLHDLESWRTKQFTPQELFGFDLENVLGKTCSLSIVHNENGKAKVVSVSALPKGMTCPPQFNPSMVFWIEPWDAKKFAALPEYFRKLIAESEEYQAMKGDVDTLRDEIDSINRELDDDIPF